jgi:hypothetical protein
MTLPPEGRAGDPPPWPIMEATPAELSRWRELWASPQAVGWEATAVELPYVARYVRLSLLVEAGEANAAPRRAAWRATSG